MAANQLCVHWYCFLYVDFMISFGLDDFLTFSFHEHVCFSQINVMHSYLAATCRKHATKTSTLGVLGCEVVKSMQGFRWRLSGLHRKMKNPRRSYSSFSISKMRWGSTYWFLSESLVSSADLKGSNTQRCIERVQPALPCLLQTVLYCVCTYMFAQSLMVITVSSNFPDIDRLDVAMTCCDNTFVRFCLGQVHSLRAAETAAAQKVQELQQLLAEASLDGCQPTVRALISFFLVCWFHDFIWSGWSFKIDFLSISFLFMSMFALVRSMWSTATWQLLVEKMQPR